MTSKDIMAQLWQFCSHNFGYVQNKFQEYSLKSVGGDANRTFIQNDIMTS
jgi:hypothetical protein